MYRILVCDDEKDIVAALKIYLESEGYAVIEAYNGREAIEKLRGEDGVHLALIRSDKISPEIINELEEMLEERRGDIV